MIKLVFFSVLIFIEQIFSSKLNTMNYNYNRYKKRELNITVLDTDPFHTSSHKELITKLTSELIEKQRIHNQKTKSKYKSYIHVFEHEPLKVDLLKEFLSNKILQYFDEINMMTIPEFKSIFETSIRIRRFNLSQNINENSPKIGNVYCNLDQLEHMKSLPVCSWHWIINERENIFPFYRAHAVCNCKNCQAKTIYDSDGVRLSKCKQVYSLMPALVKEIDSNDKINEKWWFSLEEIPTSCVCSVSVR